MSNEEKRDEVRRKIADDLNWRTDNASATARRLALAVAGIVWGVLVLNVGDKLVWQEWQRQAVLLGGAFAIAALFADWLQAIMGYCSVNRDFDRVHAIEYDPDKEKAYEIGLSYNVAQWSFFGQTRLRAAQRYLSVGGNHPVDSRILKPDTLD